MWGILNKQWKDILRLEQECFAEMDYDEHGEPKLPLLSDIIKTVREEWEQRSLQEPITPNFDVPYNDHIEDQAVIQVQDPVPLPPTQEVFQDIPVQEGTIIPIQAQENPFILPGGDNVVVDNGRPQQNICTYKDGPAKIWHLPIDGKSFEFAYFLNLSFDAISPVPAILNKASRTSKYHPEEKLQQKLSQMLSPARQMVYQSRLFLLHR
jgi:hypothetical protein